MNRPNILLVVLDATRADACSCYGAERLTTPILDALAIEGTLYEQAISPAPWTLPAFASLFTGLFPSQLGIFEQRRLSVSPPTLASLLSRHGFATFGITGNSWMSEAFGLQRGFDRFQKLWQLFQTSQDVNKLTVLQKAQPGRSWLAGLIKQLLQGNPIKNVSNAAFTHFWSYRRDYGASRTLRPLMKWIKAQQSPWFAFVHYMEAHLEYKPPLYWTRRFARDWDRVQKLLRQDQMRMAWRHIAGVEPLSEEDLAAWQDLYLAEVAYTDYHVGQLIQALRQTGRLDQTVIIVTADHGDSLGEHGLLNHQYGLYDTLIRVPLVIRYPSLFPAGRRISEQVQTLDLFATILEIAGVEIPLSPSRSLLSSPYEPRSFTVAEYGVPRIPHVRLLRQYGLRPEDLQRFARGFTALRADEYKLITGTDGSVALYAWRDDPYEKNDLSVERPEVTASLQQMLERWREEHGVVAIEDADEAWEVDPATEERLRALGYIE
jgi:arylsulfatase A-like enzyme